MPKKPPLISKVIFDFEITYGFCQLEFGRVTRLSWFSFKSFGCDLRTMNVLTLILQIGLWER